MATQDRAKPSSHQRIALFDNIKGILIALVVAGHFMHPIHNDNPALSFVFDVIYLFHMPLFVFMSGLFAKSTYRGGRLNLDRVLSFFALGLGFQLALCLVNGSSLTVSRLLRFSSAPWYLIAMSWWCLMLPLLSKLGRTRGLLFALAVSLAWGAVDMSGGFLAISRTFAFLPWFALGYYLAPSDIARIASSSRIKIFVPIAALIMLARAASPSAYSAFFPLVYGDNPYEGDLLAGMGLKLIVFGVGIVFSLALLAIAPQRASRLTVLGRRTLQVYVLHRLIRAWLTFRTPFYDMPALLDPLWGTVIITLLAAAAVAITSTRQLEPLSTRALKIPWRSLIAHARRVLAKKRDGHANAFGNESIVRLQSERSKS